MVNDSLSNVTTLTFDIFGTVLDLTGSLAAPLDRFLKDRTDSVDGAALWVDWRARQRIEQYQDNLLMLGHSGYLETCRRALTYCLRARNVPYSDAEVVDFMKVWQDLLPFDDAVRGLKRLRNKYRLVALSNGEQWYLEHLTKNRIGIEFEAVISVEKAGVFKPNPAVYRTATRLLGAEPSELMMVAAHSFDVLGARACGYRGAYVNRYRLPTEEGFYQPDIIVNDFIELADRLGA